MLHKTFVLSVLLVILRLENEIPEIPRLPEATADPSGINP